MPTALSFFVTFCTIAMVVQASVLHLTWATALVLAEGLKWSYEPCCVGQPKMDGSLWRVLTKRDPLEEGTAVELCVLPARFSGWCTGVLVPLRVVPSYSRLPSKRPWETHPRKHWYYLSENVLPVLSSRSFTVSCLMFKSLNHFECLLSFLWCLFWHLFPMDKSYLLLSNIVASDPFIG